MRGSKKTLLTKIIKTGCRFGESRHECKQLHSNKSPFIHAIGTFEQVFHRLLPLIAWTDANDISSFENLSHPILAEYLQARFAHHLHKGNDRHTFQAELSAIANLERCLTMFSHKYRACPVEYDFSQVLALFRKKALLIAKSDDSVSRALPRPMDAILALENPVHSLMAEFQYRCGCRTEGVGAPQRAFIGSNHLGLENFMMPDGGSILSTLPDPVTKLPVFQFWAKEKGGKVAWKHCPVALAQQFFLYCDSHQEGLTDRYQNYLSALNKAMRETGQYEKGRGTHVLRFNFAQDRYLACVNAGYGDEEAKLFVSREMSHNRPSITGGYLL